MINADHFFFTLLMKIHVWQAQSSMAVVCYPHSLFLISSSVRFFTQYLINILILINWWIPMEATFFDGEKVKNCTFILTLYDSLPLSPVTKQKLWGVMSLSFKWWMGDSIQLLRTHFKWLYLIFTQKILEKTKLFCLSLENNLFCDALTK